MYEPHIIFEDNHVLVVEKQPGELVQADKSGDVDMLTALKAFIKQRDSKPGNVFLGLVHRLDRNVGGVMVFAKTSKAAARLSEAIRGDGFTKIYLAVVQGEMKHKRGKLHHYLLKDTRNNKVAALTRPGIDTKEALLTFEVLKTTSVKSLVRVTLITGRSHQIRAQFAAIGHPLIGDVKYGGLKGESIALWAHQLSFEHPTLHEPQTFTSEAPTVQPWLF